MKLNDFLLLANNMVIPRDVIPRDNWNNDTTKVEHTGLPNENLCQLDETVFVSIVRTESY